MTEKFSKCKEGIILVILGRKPLQFYLNLCITYMLCVLVRTRGLGGKTITRHAATSGSFPGKRNKTKKNE